MKKSTGSRITFFGVCIFIVLYFIAAYLYPGGSQTDKTVKDFSWLNNYWCDLLSEQAKNGQHNTVRPIAITSWLILCFSLLIFWYFLPELVSVNRKIKNIIRFCGIIAMLIATFLFTQLHDVVIHAASLFGLIAFTGAFVGFYKSRLYGFFYTGLFCIALMGLNYFIMVGNTYISYLPLIQKISFVIVLAWILFINRELYRSGSENSK